MSKAVKHDQGKPQLSYISRELMESLAKVRAFGASKYERDNWKGGFKYTRTLDALLRHTFAFLSGEDTDPESGLPHPFHMAANIEHLIYDYIHHKHNDDRGLQEPEQTSIIISGGSDESITKKEADLPVVSSGCAYPNGPHTCGGPYRCTD